jgi:UDP-4-amino-4,6-dideoxy-N-acetyl-beta-L-altrosamine transaminase
MKPIHYGKQEITQDDIDAVIESLKCDFLTQGPKVDLFEDVFSSYVGSKFAIACTNGTAALHLSALALNVNEKSHFITTPITFVASANCILYCGGKISFCDIDSTTGLLDLEKLQEMIASKPKGYYTGVIGVHLGGFPINMELLKKICDQYELTLIEDACHAPGAYFHNSKGKKQLCGNGKYADSSIFSFHPVKHVATGEGGMITTDSQTVAERLKLLRTHGITKDTNKMKNIDGPWYYEMQELGFNYRLPDILCALGISQLQRLDQSLSKRHEVAKLYDQAFLNHSDIQLQTTEGTSSLKKQGIFHGHHLYIIKIKRRLELYNYLASKNIFCQVHYIPIYRLPFYSRLGYTDHGFSNSEKYYHTALSIPMYPSLSKQEQEYVIENILDFFKK